MFEGRLPKFCIIFVIRAWYYFIGICFSDQEIWEVWILIMNCLPMAYIPYIFRLWDRGVLGMDSCCMRRVKDEERNDVSRALGAKNEVE